MPYTTSADRSEINIRHVAPPTEEKPGSRGIITTHAGAAEPFILGAFICEVCRTLGEGELAKKQPKVAVTSAYVRCLTRKCCNTKLYLASNIECRPGLLSYKCNPISNLIFPLARKGLPAKLVSHVQKSQR